MHQFPPAKLSIGDGRHACTGDPSVLCGEFILDRGYQDADDCLRDRCEGGTGGNAVGNSS